MHGCTTRKVQTSQAVCPPGRVPCPAGNGVIDNGGPNEHEDDARQHATALSDGAYGEGHGDCTKHALIDGEQEVRDAARAHRGLREDVLEAKVGEVADEEARGVREGKRVAPEEPLKGGHRRSHDRQPYQGKGGFSSGQARVKESV